MSKIALKGNASGTGTFQIEAPNSNTDRTLNLPDEAGTVITSVSDIESQVKTATNATGSAPIYACRAWVNFDGTSTVTIRASGNVSSITDEGTGLYAINLTTAMPDINYSVVTGGGENLGDGSNSIRLPVLGGIFATTVFDLEVRNSSNALVDPEQACAAVFR